MTIISGNIHIAVNFRNYYNADLTTPAESIDEDFIKTYTINQNENLYSATKTIDPSSSWNINVSDGSLKDNFGNVLTNENILFVVVNYVGKAGEALSVYIKNPPWLNASGTDDVTEEVMFEQTVVHTGNWPFTGNIEIQNIDADDEATVNVIIGSYGGSTGLTGEL